MISKDTAVPIRDDIFWIGGDDRTATIFEGAFPIPEGVSYNSYLISSEGKTCLLDTVDSSIASKFWRNLRKTMDGRDLDYLIIDHMEPDHGACITQVLEAWPEVTVVGNSKTFDMLENFYRISPKNRMVVKEGDELVVGKHTLRFYFAVMVEDPLLRRRLRDVQGGLRSALCGRDRLRQGLPERGQEVLREHSR